MTIGCAILLACLALAAPAMGLGEPRQVRDIGPGTADSSITYPASFGGRLLFSANDGTHGPELWSSDGTPAGTTLFKDIREGSEGAFPIGMTEARGELIFRASDGDHGAEPWASDGTPAGTAMVDDLRQGAAGSNPVWAAIGDTRVYFQADDGERGNELWFHRGAAFEPTLVEDLNPDTEPGVAGRMVAIGDTVYFAGNNGPGFTLWKSDGTAGGTRRVSDVGFVDVTPLLVLNGKLLFSGVTADGNELWISDGTPEGTTMLKDIAPGMASGLPLSPAAVDLGGTALFVADEDGIGGGSAPKLWKTEGTAETTEVVDDVTPTNGTLTAIGDVGYFAGNDGESGRELWRSDGTSANTRRVADIHPAESALPFDVVLTAIDGRLFFAADDGEDGLELWTSDGTGPGTKPVADLVPGAEGSAPDSITQVDGDVFFVAHTDAFGRELWSFPLDAPPAAADDGATVAEDATATAIDVLANDTDADGGPLAVASVTQPANGRVSIAAGGSGLTYRPDRDYCTSGGPTDDFTYALAPGGDTATVAVTVTCAPGPPPPPPAGTAIGNRLAKVERRVARLRLRCPGAGACEGRVTLSMRMRRGKRTVRIVIGATRFSIASGKAETVRIRLHRAARSRLAKSPSGRLRVKLAGTGVKPRTVVLEPA